MTKKPVNQKPAMILTTSDLRKLDRLEGIVDDHLKSAHNVWAALREIRDKNYYMHRATTWDEYLRKCWPNQISTREADRLIGGISALENVDGLEVTPPGGRLSSETSKSHDQPLTLTKDNFDRSAAIELAKLGDAKEQANVTAKAMAYVKPSKDGNILITAGPIKRAVEAASVAAPVIPEEEDDEEEYVELTAADIAKEMASEIEKVCRSVLKAFKDGLNELPGTARVFTQSKGMDDASEAAIKKALATLRRTKPVVCPVCTGEGCQHCEDEGMVTTDKASSLKGVTE